MKKTDTLIPGLIMFPFNISSFQGVENSSSQAPAGDGGPTECRLQTFWATWISLLHHFFKGAKGIFLEHHGKNITKWSWTKTIDILSTSCKFKFDIEIKWVWRDFILHPWCCIRMKPQKNKPQKITHRKTFPPGPTKKSSHLKDLRWVVPPPSNCGKWRFIGIPY